MSQPTFIGIGHKKQHGKDTFASYLEAHLRTHTHRNCEIVSYADPLKRLAMATYGLTHAQCHGPDVVKDSPTEVLASTFKSCWDWGDKKLTARQVLQHLGGTMRMAVPHILSDAPFRTEYEQGVDYVLLPDTRFEDEALNVQIRGGINIRMWRPDVESDGHESETALDAWHGWDCTVVNDGSLDQLDQTAWYVAKYIRDGSLMGDDELIVHAQAGPVYDVRVPRGKPYYVPSKEAQP